jgi:DNA-directed RNA polymerase specialized sigma24 family protein
MDVQLASDEAVYERLAPELIRFATGLVGRDDAPDVMATASLKAMSSPSWESVREPRAYLYQAVLNEARTWSRRRSVRPSREAAAARRDETVEPTAIDPATAAWTRPRSGSSVTPTKVEAGAAPRLSKSS